MYIKEEIKKHFIEFKLLCQKYKVKTMYAFGSATTDTFNLQTSDIDLLVEVDVSDPIERGELLLNLWDSLEAFFKRKVDLITDGSIRNPYLLKSIQSTKVLIYDR